MGKEAGPRSFLPFVFKNQAPPVRFKVRVGFRIRVGFRVRV